MTAQADMEARACPAPMHGNFYQNLTNNTCCGYCGAVVVPGWSAATKTASPRELGILDRVLTDAENAIYDAGMAAAYARAMEVCRRFEAMHLDLIQNRDRPTKIGIRIARQFANARRAIEALGEAKG